MDEVLDPGLAETFVVLQAVARLRDGEGLRITRLGKAIIVEKIAPVASLLASSFSRFDEGEVSFSLPDPDRPCPACHSAALQVLADGGVRCAGCGVVWKEKQGG